MEKTTLQREVKNWSLIEVCIHTTKIGGKNHTPEVNFSISIFRRVFHTGMREKNDEFWLQCKRSNYALDYEKKRMTFL